MAAAKVETKLPAHVPLVVTEVKLPPAETDDWTEDEKKYLNLLNSFNGMDYYSTETVGLGTIPENQYLQLPRDYPIPTVTDNHVGTKGGKLDIPLKHAAAIYALNKTVCADTNDAIRFATARLEAVRAGWVTDQREIKLMDPPEDALDVYRTDLAAICAIEATARTYAFIQPLVAEFVFRTTGHHYLSGSGQVEEYRAKYHKVYTAVLSNDLVNFMGNANQFHACLHWVSPARAWSVLKAQVDTATIPDAIKIRISAAPAGTALITTTMAILDLAKSTGVTHAIGEYMGVNIGIIQATADKIKSNPVRYHKVFTAYKFPKISEQEAKEIADVLDMAKLVAPVTQAIIEVYGRDTELAKAKVLKKYSLSNPLLTKRLRNYLRAQTGKESTSLKEVFSFSGTGAEE